MLDTNTLSYLAKQQSVAAERRLASMGSEDRAVISSVTYGECRFGIAQALRAGKKLPPYLFELLKRFEVLPWNASEAQVYGRLRAQLKSMGKAVAPLDTMIAAHAVAVGATLVSSDRAFVGVPGLQHESWAREFGSFRSGRILPLD
jgi:tRNA(fMet)-specific endonuclease VapC